MHDLIMNELQSDYIIKKTLQNTVPLKGLKQSIPFRERWGWGTFSKNCLKGMSKRFYP